MKYKTYWNNNEKCTNTFNALKEKVTSSSILAFPDFNSDFNYMSTLVKPLLGLFYLKYKKKRNAL